MNAKTKTDTPEAETPPNGAGDAGAIAVAAAASIADQPQPLDPNRPMFHLVPPIIMQDVMEHFDPCSGVTCRHFAGSCVVGIMEEIHRVLVPGGFLIANTPSTNGDGAWGDPSHKSGWNMWSVNYHTEKVQAGYLGQFAGEPTCKFIRHRAYEWFPSQWHEANNLKYLHFTLGALKPGVYGLSSLR